MKRTNSLFFLSLSLSLPTKKKKKSKRKWGEGRGREGMSDDFYDEEVACTFPADQIKINGSLRD